MISHVSSQPPTTFRTSIADITSPVRTTGELIRYLEFAPQPEEVRNLNPQEKSPSHRCGPGEFEP
jgi:hypothetical protein